MNVLFEQFNSISELLRTIDNRPVDYHFRGCESSQQKGNKSWKGTTTYDEAEKLLINGWNEHIQQMREGISSRLNKAETGQINKRRPQNSVVGFTPHVPNAILGLPHSMIEIKQQPQKVKTITIIYNTSVLADWTPEQVLKSGIAVLRLINKIEQDGVKVRLISEFKSSIMNNVELGVVRVILKDFKDHLDLKKLAFPFANAGMQRRIGFRWQETVPGQTQDWSNSYGRSIGDVYDYEQCIEMLKSNGLLNGNEYYITVQFCYKKCKNDPVVLAKKLNIKY
jgi:hypothetical protein